MTRPHRQAAHPTVVRAEERSYPCTEIIRLAPIGVKRTAMCRTRQVCGPVRIKWARLLDSLPDVSQYRRCARCLSGTTCGIKGGQTVWECKIS
jgi:hypothetical protein